MSKQPRVLVCGPASWNQIIELERLPDPQPQQLVARNAWHTVGGTSAGKALHLSSLGVSTALFASIGEDQSGNKLREVLVSAGLDLHLVPSETTEQHVNLMSQGQRISIYVATPSAASNADVEAVVARMSEADLAVIDLSELGLRLIERMGKSAIPLWVDLHDYDGMTEFHQPFLGAAAVVFMNDDATDDPWELLGTCLNRGPELAICTLGPRGAMAMDRHGQRWKVAAREVAVVDTNGAGDAFMAGFLAAYLRAESVQECLEAASDSAAVALSSRHLHPIIEKLI
ncbi:carbohydrate kinase family protein [Glutamicibacter sp. JC586]|uniref:carbohydrate kinase family protein n=1 Tax=Glutamicibacter sp. JC586 TaxID=2590552 RepID=UPI001359F313|nr:PfkB family carbohydrate kinase [Glutamicibacter sp. JC586]